MLAGRLGSTGVHHISGQGAGHGAIQRVEQIADSIDSSRKNNHCATTPTMVRCVGHSTMLRVAFRSVSALVLVLLILSVRHVTNRDFRGSDDMRRKEAPQGPHVVGPRLIPALQIHNPNKKRVLMYHPTSLISTGVWHCSEDLRCQIDGNFASNETVDGILFDKYARDLSGCMVFGLVP